MIDIHCHILPEIDDGARDIYDTVEMASIAERCGTKAIIATPHCNVPGEPANYYDSRFRDVLQKAREALFKERIPLKLMAGMEVFVTYDLPDLISDGKILTLNQSDYLLMEFGFGEDPEFVDYMIDRIKDMKIRPVIAHPERYEFIKYDIEFARRLAQKGCVLQANKGSFIGRYGRGSEETAFSLLEENLISVVATDAHGPITRTPNIREAYDTLKKACDVRKLFEENPQKLCANQPI